jgi:hypothetical protein
VLVLPLIAALWCAGCAKQRSDEPEPPFGAVTVIDPKTFALSLDACQLTAAERTSIQQAQNLMFVRCMQKFGFTIDVPAARTLPFATTNNATA